MTIRIFVADDHPIVRQGVRMLLEAEPDFAVVGGVGSGIQAIDAVTQRPPDVLIVDLAMPDVSGIEVTRAVRQQQPAVKVIILSMYDDESYVDEALQAGATAYVLKKSTAEELAQAVRTVIDGGIFLSPPLDEDRLSAYARRHAEPGPSDLYDNLTARERQVLQMAAHGLNNPAIAQQLGLSVRTVEMHRAHLMQKLRLKNQTDLVRYAVKRGLVESP